MPNTLLKLKQRLPDFMRLMRFDRPIGTFLLLWPTLWALMLAGDGKPPIGTVIIFTLGVILMRAAGCVINDFADRKIDGHVKRTKDRPLATGVIQPKEALILFAALCITSFLLVLLTNSLTVYLSFGALVLAACYPFMKRHTHLPQMVLGAAFAWAIPMSFAAVTGKVPADAWFIYTIVVIWTLTYDTFYAMADRQDDVKIGVKSTAVLFGEMDRPITASLQCLVVMGLFMMGGKFDLGLIYTLSVVGVGALFAYQQHLIRQREPQACIQAFLNNNYVGAIIFIGIALDPLVS